MGILFLGIVTFILAFLIHFLIWKFFLPKTNHTIVLLIIFFGVCIAAITASRILNNGLLGDIVKPKTLFDYADFFVLYSSFVLAYIATYSAIEVDSPSLIMVLAIAEASTRGLERKIFYNTMDDEILIIPRIEDLVRDKMIYIDNERYKLTPKGVFLAIVFSFFRKVLNAPMGG